MDVGSIEKSDFGALMTHFQELPAGFERAATARSKTVVGNQESSQTV